KLLSSGLRKKLRKRDRVEASALASTLLETVRDVNNALEVAGFTGERFVFELYELALERIAGVGFLEDDDQEILVEDPGELVRHLLAGRSSEVRWHFRGKGGAS